MRHLPNAVTCVALCSGLTAVHLAVGGRYMLAAVAIATAAALDALDGGLARLLHAHSKFGAELDSLSDLVAFGAAPALVLSFWQLDAAGPGGWLVALVFALCIALRLARFNSLLDAGDAYPFSRRFFTGMPAPAAALVALLPLLVGLQLGDGWWSAPATVVVWTLLTAALAVSRLPTPSLKVLRLRPHLAAVAVALTILLAAAPLAALTALVVGYLLSLPYAASRHAWLRRHPEAWADPARRSVRAQVRRLAAVPLGALPRGRQRPVFISVAAGPPHRARGVVGPHRRARYGRLLALRRRA